MSGLFVDEHLPEEVHRFTGATPCGRTEGVAQLRTDCRFGRPPDRDSPSTATLASFTPAEEDIIGRLQVRSGLVLGVHLGIAGLAIQLLIHRLPTEQWKAFLMCQQGWVMSHCMQAIWMLCMLASHH